MFDRFEAKHQIAKQYASVCRNFTNIISSIADVHQMNHCAEMYEIKCPVKEELKYPRKKVVKPVSQMVYAEELKLHGLPEDDLVMVVKNASQGGFEYNRHSFVTLPTRINNLPLFAKVMDVLIYKNRCLLVIEPFKTIKYDELFAAFLIEHEENPSYSVMPATTFSEDPLSVWKRFDHPNLQYLSLRRSQVGHFYESFFVLLLALVWSYC